MYLSIDFTRLHFLNKSLTVITILILYCNLTLIFIHMYIVYFLNISNKKCDYNSLYINYMT